jgi:hypothetical protein
MAEGWIEVNDAHGVAQSNAALSSTIGRRSGRACIAILGEG